MSDPVEPGTSFRWNGREVRNPAVRALAVVAAGLVAVAVTLGVVLAFMFAFAPLMVIFAVLVVVALALHPILRAFGRRGFVERSAEDGTTVTISGDAFRRSRSI